MHCTVTPCRGNARRAHSRLVGYLCRRDVAPRISARRGRLTDVTIVWWINVVKSCCELQQLGPPAILYLTVSGSNHSAFPVGYTLRKHNKFQRYWAMLGDILSWRFNKFCGPIFAGGAFIPSCSELSGWSAGLSRGVVKILNNQIIK